MARGKNPTAEQRKLLMRNDHDPNHWLYVGEKVIGDSGYKRLGKDETKTKYLVFRNRMTEREIQLPV